MTRSFSAVGAHQGARSPTISVKVCWFSLSQRCASSSVRSTRPWWAPSRTTSSSRLPATGLMGSARKRGSSASSTIAARSSSRTRERPAWRIEATSSQARRALRSTPSQPPTRRLSRAESMRCRTIASCRKFSPTNSWRLRPSISLRRGISAVCGIGSPIGCLNSAVTANQSAIAPTMEASAAALTKPSQPSWSSVTTKTTAATSSSETASVRIRRRPRRRSSSSSGFAVTIAAEALMVARTYLGDPTGQAGSTRRAAGTANADGTRTTATTSSASRTPKWLPSTPSRGGPTRNAV